jgi:ABC-type sugar transport system ATPase subunit
MNLFEGDLVSRNGGLRFVAHGVELPLAPEIVERMTESAGPSVILGVRPEDVILHLESGLPEALVGRVTVVESLGPETIVTLETPFGDVVARVLGMQAIDFDEQVSFSLDPAGLHLFDAKTGNAVLRPGQAKMARVAAAFSASRR